MMLRTGVGVLCACFMSLAGSTASAQVVQTSAGSVEFLGLEKWTPAEIQQRLGYTSPDQLHYCAADLKKLGFPEVAVLGYSKNGNRNFVVTVVEPDRAGEVEYKAQPTQHIPLSAEWIKLKVLPEEPHFMEGGILDYSRLLPGSLADRPWLSDGTPQAWWPKVQAFRTEKQFEQARQILEHSDDRDARVVAAVVMMNFASDDVAWRSLVSGLRDPDGQVQSTCLQALNSLATFHPRRVDWSRATADLAALLHGTDLFAFQFVLKTLTETKVDTTLASPLLGHGGARLVMAYLRATNDDERDLAHGFLVGMAGRDLGNEPAAWQNWVEHL